MILQALARYYDDLLQQGKISAPGWTKVKISYALDIGLDGQLKQVVSILKEEPMGKKTVQRPQEIALPAPVGRSSLKVASNFLWDNSGYLLGIKKNEKPERSLKCFQNARELHHALLDGVDSPAAKAILNFFDTWEPEKAAQHPDLSKEIENVTAGGNLLFRVDNSFVQDDPLIQEAWNRVQGETDENAVKMQCLVTGREDEIARTHPLIKGVQGAQMAGAALVTFNGNAFCSYGHEQNYNAPVGKHAAFAYTAALNHLLSDRNSVQHIGDTTVVCWAEGAEEAYQNLAQFALFGQEMPGLTDNDLRAALKRLANGLPCDDLGVDPKRPFYVLGLAPNAARLSVRFFLHDSFGKLMKNVNDHYDRMEIVRPSFDKQEILPLWLMLRETVNLNSRDKSPSPAMAGATVRAVFSGGPYPASLLEAVMLRIHAETDREGDPEKGRKPTYKITRGRMAIIKAYYLKNPHPDCPKEVLTVSLNEASTNPAYVLGRLFSVYEAVQRAGNDKINATIKDKYFNSAAAMPASVFPILNNLYQKHLRKLPPRLRSYFDNQVVELKSKLGESYPARMTLAQQGAFDLGYYHQRNANPKKEEEKDG